MANEPTILPRDVALLAEIARAFPPNLQPGGLAIVMLPPEYHEAVVELMHKLRSMLPSA